MATEERAERLAALAAEEGLDALIVGDLVTPGDSGPDAIANVRWLTGFSGTSGLAIVGPGRREFLTDFRYAERAERQVGDAFERVIFDGPVFEELGKRLSGRVGFDPAATSVRNHRKLAAAVGDDVELVAVDGLVERLRRVKDEGEVAAIAAAARLADEALEWLLERGIVGKTERRIAFELETRMRELGAEPSFPTIVASGPNGALPHAFPTEREVQAKELVTIDWGAKLDGYCSDGTRTFATGELDDELRSAYELVLRAQLAGIEAVAAGAHGRVVDAAARRIIEEAGMGEHFGHGLGHGVGMQVHEPPRLSKRSEDTLESGNVVTVEPGVYVPGRFGLRIEDLVVVTDREPKNLSGLPKELQVVS
ncbi:MAG TPA: aminopeptidase P family protein [Solirubrobacterales bacterium]